MERLRSSSGNSNRASEVRRDSFILAQVCVCVHPGGAICDSGLSGIPVSYAHLYGQEQPGSQACTLFFSFANMFKKTPTHRKRG